MPFFGVTRRCLDRKSTRLNSSHTVISYAVFCLKKKNRLDQAAISGEQLHQQHRDLIAVLGQQPLEAGGVVPAGDEHLIDPDLPGFFCNDTATTGIYTLSLHDALPI